MRTVQFAKNTLLPWFQPSQRRRPERFRHSRESEGDIQLEPNGARAFVAVGAANSVAVIDLKGLKIIRRLATGPAPDGLAWAELK